MAYAGLETLFENMGPTYAATMAGQREGTARGLDQLTAQKEQEEIRAKQQAYDQAERMNPGEVTAQGLKNTGLGLANTHAGLVNTSAQQGIDLTTETQPGVIKATNSNNALVPLQNKVKQTEAYSQILGDGAATLGQMPVLARAEAFKSMLGQMGVDQNAPEYAALIQEANSRPEHLPQMLTALRQQVVQAGAAYQQAIAVQELHNKASAYTADQGLKGHLAAAGATKYAADVGAQSHETIAGIQEEKAIAVQTMKMKLQEEYIKVRNDPTLSPVEKRRQLDELVRDAQVMNPQYGTAIDTNALGVPRNADTSGKKLTDEDLLKKYGGK